MRDLRFNREVLIKLLKDVKRVEKLAKSAPKQTNFFKEMPPVVQSKDI